MVLLFLMLLRVGIIIKYDEGFSVSAKAACLNFSLYPRSTEKDKSKQVEKRVKQENKQHKGTPKEQNKLDEFQKAIDPILKALSRLKKKLYVNRVILRVTAGASDPYEAAMKFGKISAALGVLSPIFDNTFNVKKRNISADVDFQIEEDKIFFFIDLSMAVWEIIYVVCALVPLLGINKPSKEMREVKNNGQASHK